MKTLPSLLTFTFLALPAQAVVIINDASITAMPPDDVENGSNTYDFDVNGDGQIDWSIRANTTRFSESLSAQASPSTGFIYQTPQPGDQPRVYPLDSATLIGASLGDSTYSWYNGFGAAFSSQVNGDFYGSFFLKEGYLGFQFEADDGTHYGYAFLDSHSSSRMTISQVAWETEPGKAILAGNIPEPSSLLLIMLSIGIASARRRRG